MSTSIDARGRSCPQPVLMAKEAIQSGETSYQIIVDNHAAKENVSRFAAHSGYNVSVTEADGEYTLELNKQ